MRYTHVFYCFILFASEPQCGSGHRSGSSTLALTRRRLCTGFRARAYLLKHGASCSAGGNHPTQKGSCSKDLAAIAPQSTRHLIPSSCLIQVHTPATRAGPLSLSAHTPATRAGPLSLSAPASSAGLLAQHAPASRALVPSEDAHSEAGCSVLAPWARRWVLAQIRAPDTRRCTAAQNAKVCNTDIGRLGCNSVGE